MHEKLWAVVLVVLALMLSNTSSSWADSGTLRINEIMASNSSTISDEDGDQPDWIEIYNPTEAAVN
jgi:hypothetical protein